MSPRILRRIEVMAKADGVWREQGTLDLPSWLTFVGFTIKL